MQRHRITWGELVAIEPTPAELARHAPALAAAYNDPHNARLLGHTALLDERDVQDHYAGLAAGDGHGFVLLQGGELAGDGDLRGVHGGAGELAFLIARVGAQGRGLGTRFAIMLHAFAFGPLGLDRLYASVRPDNPASCRVFAKLGHAIATDPAARAYAEEPDDLVFAIERAAFQRSHAAALAELDLAVRSSAP